ncbi:MAG: DNA translocase FtsK, partial [Syntrophobacteraceae bacterium]
SVRHNGSERDVIIDSSRGIGEKFPATGLEGTAMSVKAREAQPLPPSVVPSVRHNGSERDVIFDSSRVAGDKFPTTGLEGAAMSVKTWNTQPLPLGTGASSRTLQDSTLPEKALSGGSHCIPTPVRLCEPVVMPNVPSAPPATPAHTIPDYSFTETASADRSEYPSVRRCEPAVRPEGPAPCTPIDGDDLFRPKFQGDVCLPPVSLLHPAESSVAPMSQDDLIDGGILIEEKLAEFRVKVNVQDAYAGPVITRYEVQPAVGVRGGQVVSLMRDLARALGVAAIRVVETIPGKTCMGLELPNPRRQMIHLSEVLSSDVFQSHASKLAIVLGKDITGEPVVVDLAKAPHMLVAGTTGSGKSVGVNAMILSLLYRATPDEVRFVMIDPKMLELSIYDGIPHLLAPVVTDMKLAANALTWCVAEMERRYRLMSGLHVRNLAGYNQKVRDAMEAGEPLMDPLSLTLDSPTPLSHLPYIVVVVDELADLMMVAGKKIEELIARLAQKARAAGIHLIIATQRPSVDVITGLIKANIPTRIAFQVSSKIDSRTILDQMGAECLLGQGDMLYLPPGTGYPQRVHGAFVADEEVHAVAGYLKQFGEPQYVEGVLGGLADAEQVEAERFGEESDPLYDDAVAFVISSRRASISAVQRQLRIGYNRAARLVEQMEASGLVSPMESNGNRTILVPARQE